jgi:hypothetical protein
MTNTDIGSLVMPNNSDGQTDYDGVSITNSLLLLYFFGANKFVYKLMPDKTRNIFESNKYIHHLMSYLTLVAIMSFVLKKKSKKKVILYSLICYIWFLLTLKLSSIYFFSLLVILIMGYVTEILIKDKNYKLKNIPSDVMTDQEKESSITKLKQFRTFFISTALFTTLVGYIYPQDNNTGAMVGGGDSSILDYLFN